VLAEVTRDAKDFTHPLLETRELRKRCVIVVSTDKGLCGSLNSNLLREAAKFDKDTTVYITAGRKASQFVARTKRQLAAEFTYKDAPLFSEARAISKFARDMFTKGEVDHVDIVFTKFISTLSQRPEAVQLLPVGQIKAVTAGVEGHALEEELSSAGGVEYLFEPSAAQVLGELLPHYLNFRIYQILLEAKASEHSARMVAMKNATDNAQQIIKDLTLEYNKLRQANITKELLEITTAQMALGN
jgi:F-type H+-transporting ATPase subunit gamma